MNSWKKSTQRLITWRNNLCLRKSLCLWLLAAGKECQERHQESFLLFCSFLVILYHSQTQINLCDLLQIKTINTAVNLNLVLKLHWVDPKFGVVTLPISCTILWAFGSHKICDLNILLLCFSTILRWCQNTPYCFK